MLVKVEIYKEGKYWCARGIGEDVFTQGKTLDELMKNLAEAVELHFEELPRKEEIRILSISDIVNKASDLCYGLHVLLLIKSLGSLPI